MNVCLQVSVSFEQWFPSLFASLLNASSVLIMLYYDDSGLFDRLMALSLGMMMDRTGFSFSEDNFNCSSEKSFCFHFHLNRISSFPTN